MAERKPEIIRSEVITVKSASKNQYGDLMVNGTLKVGNKRSNLFGIFQEGAEVKIGYASYMNKEYIAIAEQIGEHKALPPPTTPPLNTEPLKPSPVAPLIPHSEPPLVDFGVTNTVKDTRLRSMALSYAKDMAVAGKIDLKTIRQLADEFLGYILNIPKEVQTAKSTLVKEAEKLGGKIIKEEGMDKK